MSKRINNALKCVPVYLWLIIFTVVPLLMVFFYAIFEVQDGGSIHFTLAYLKEAVTNGQYLDAIWRSLEYALISTIVCLVIGYPLAFILANPLVLPLDDVTLVSFGDRYLEIFRKYCK